MKNTIKTIAAVLCGLMLIGCESETAFGKCIGISEDGDPGLKYKVSVRNAAIGIIFAELIVPPIVVLVDETFCPVGTKYGLSPNGLLGGG